MGQTTADIYQPTDTEDETVLQAAKGALAARHQSWTWACEVAAMRLLKKCKKETLIMLCNDFGIPTSGNKEKLAEEAAEQLHYETDDESDDDE